MDSPIENITRMSTIGLFTTFIVGQKVTDLVFFVNDKNRIHHVGIAWGKNQIIHASGQVRIDQLTNDGIIHSSNNKLTHRLYSIKRIME